MPGNFGEGTIPDPRIFERRIPVKFVQASDLHLDAPFASLSPKLAARRREEQIDTFERLLDLVRDERADVLLLPGDLFERGATRPETVRRVASALGRLHPLPVLIAPGNHDPIEERGFWSMPFPENVTIFGSAWQAVHLGEVTVHGKGFSRTTAEADPMADFPGPGEATVICLHADFVGEGQPSAYAPVTARDFAHPRLLHVALGHIHKPWSPAPGVAYAGSLEPLGFKEEGAHGAILGEAGPGRKTALQRIPLARRAYVTRVIVATGADRSHVGKVLDEALKGLEAEGAVLRLRLQGSRIADDPDASEWIRAMGERGFEGEVEDDRHPPQAEEADPLTLRGRFLERMEARIREAAPDEVPILRQAIQDGLAALSRRKIVDY